jgi:cadmium resistance protein CadD (predicted permease)
MAFELDVMTCFEQLARGAGETHHYIIYLLVYLWASKKKKKHHSHLFAGYIIGTHTCAFKLVVFCYFIRDAFYFIEKEPLLDK